MKLDLTGKDNEIIVGIDRNYRDWSLHKIDFIKIFKDSNFVHSNKCTYESEEDYEGSFGLSTDGLYIGCFLNDRLFYKIEVADLFEGDFDLLAYLNEGDNFEKVVEGNILDLQELYEYGQIDLIKNYLLYDFGKRRINPFVVSQVLDSPHFTKEEKMALFFDVMVGDNIADHTFVEEHDTLADSMISSVKDIMSSTRTQDKIVVGFIGYETLKTQALMSTDLAYNEEALDSIKNAVSRSELLLSMDYDNESDRLSDIHNHGLDIEIVFDQEPFIVVETYSKAVLVTHEMVDNYKDRTIANFIHDADLGGTDYRSAANSGSEILGKHIGKIVFNNDHTEGCTVYRELYNLTSRLHGLGSSGHDVAGFFFTKGVFNL